MAKIQIHLTWKLLSRSWRIYYGNVTSLCSTCDTSRSSVCRLSVMMLHPTHRLELFRNIFAPLDSLY